MPREIADEMWCQVLDFLNSLTAEIIKDVTWVQDQEQDTCAYKEVKITFRKPVHITTNDNR